MFVIYAMYLKLYLAMLYLVLHCGIYTRARSYWPHSNVILHDSDLCNLVVLWIQHLSIPGTFYDIAFIT